MSDEQHVAAPHASPFDAIRHVDEQGNEYWSARELSRILGYNDYRNFQDVVKKAEISCEQSGYAVSDHFGDVTGMIQAGKGAKRKRTDVHLTYSNKLSFEMRGARERKLKASFNSPV